MSNLCPECGAPVPVDGTCRDNFHALLFLEAEVPGGPGTVAHFYAVASYGLQHPESMGYTTATLEGLRAEVETILSGESTIPQLRHRVRARAAEAGRVTRREGDPVPIWSVGAWPVNVTYVLEGGTEEYCTRVEQWARSVVDTLSSEPGASAGR